MMTRLNAADGHAFECWLAEHEGPRMGGLVILQEIFGVTDQLKGVAARYAALGYDVAVPALFDRQAPGAVVPFNEPLRGRALMMAASSDETVKDISASVAALKERGGKVGVVGFCWGGGLALRAAQTCPIDAGISFYGTRLPEYLNQPLNAPVQGHFGGDDDHVPPSMLAKAREYFLEMEVFVYEGAGHAFANDARPDAYNAEAAELAHQRTAAFLAQHVSGA